MTTMDDYRTFIEGKIAFDSRQGFDVADADIHPILKPHQRDIVRWACAGGRRAIFAAFGLGKSVMQLEILRLTLAHLGVGSRALIICPLGVRQEFVRDAAMLGLSVTFVRHDREITGAGLYLTNYESVRDGRLDPNQFEAVSLDEASVLRSFGSKTYQTFLSLFDLVQHRYVATATPSPNRDAAMGVTAAAGEKRATLDVRVAKAAELVNGSDDHFIVWHGYFADGVDYLRRQDAEASVPSLFDALADGGVA